MSVILRGKDCSEDVSHESSNTMFSKDIERVVNTNNKFELCCIVASRTANDAEYYRRPSRHLVGMLIKLNITVRVSGLTYPDPGVIATNPAITPEQNPTVDHLCSNR